MYLDKYMQILIISMPGCKYVPCPTDINVVSISSTTIIPGLVAPSIDTIPYHTRHIYTRIPYI